MSSVKIVAGSNGIPVALEAIAPPLLHEFASAESVLTEYHDFVARRLDGNRNWVNVGKPYVKWTLAHLTRAEYALLATYNGVVTITTLNQTTNQFHTYNGMCKSTETNADVQWDGNSLRGWTDCVMTIFDLVLIS